MNRNRKPAMTVQTLADGPGYETATALSLRIATLLLLGYPLTTGVAVRDRRQHRQLYDA